MNGPVAEVGVRKLQAAQTEAELKAAAVRVFERVGYLNAKITDITAGAGRATGSFYKHFTSKENLLEALLTDLLGQTDETVLNGPHPDDFRDREAVHWHVAMFVRFYREHRAVMVALQQAATVDESFAQRQRALIEPDLHHQADHLRGLSLPADPVVIASMINGLMWSFAATWLDAGLSDEAVIEALTSFIHAGLLGSGPQAG